MMMMMMTYKYFLYKTTLKPERLIASYITKDNVLLFTLCMHGQQDQLMLFFI